MSFLVNLIFFLGIIISVHTATVNSDKLCDKRDSSLVIDSAVAFTQNPHIFWLFSGNLVYQSNPVDINANAKPKFDAKKVKEINHELETPIDMAYKFNNYKNELLLSLYNENSHSQWDLDNSFRVRLASEWFPFPEDVHYFDASYNDGPDSVYHFGQQSNLAFYVEYYNGNYTNAVYGIFGLSVDQKQVRFISFDSVFMITTAVKRNQFKGILNNVTVEGVVTFKDNSAKNWIYLFAGRQLCRFQWDISGKWTEFCSIEDIADWADCSGQKDP